jgi:hypothetical protein
MAFSAQARLGSLTGKGQAMKAFEVRARRVIGQAGCRLMKSHHPLGWQWGNTWKRFLVMDERNIPVDACDEDDLPELIQRWA